MKCCKSKEKYCFETLTFFKEKNIYLVGRNVPFFQSCCDYSKHVLESRNTLRIFQFCQIHCFLPEKVLTTALASTTIILLLLQWLFLQPVCYIGPKRLLLSLQAQNYVPQLLSITDSTVFTEALLIYVIEEPVPI